MSRTSRSTVVALVAATLIPAAVTAAPAAAAPASAPSAAGVAGHVLSATKASKRVAKYARRGNDRAAARYLVQARREAVTGAREARKLAARASTSPAAAQQAVAGLTAAAATYGNATQDFSTLVGTTSGPLQAALVNAIPGSVAGRTQLLGLLSTLIPQLSGDARDQAVKSMAALQVGAPGQVADLAQAATLAALPASLQGILDAALAAATAALDDGLAQVTALLPTLPEGEQIQVAQALGLVSATLKSIAPLLAQTTGLVSKTLDSVFALVSGLIPQVTAITGVVPGAGTPGTAPAAGTPLGGLGGLIPGLGGLLGGLGGLIPGLGGLLGGR
ncbi:MAG: hypothetical protein M3417_05790 [Actinomycetota bacterium]|nr:hypothetical protein [Actinomycetota bacterium]